VPADAPTGGGFVAPSCCEECGCFSYSQEFHQTFGVMVCLGCKRDDKFRLISKAVAKEQYLLTDNDLKKLGFVTKSNPQHKQWSEMKLYLQLQVAEAATLKHGDISNIAGLKQQRLEARIGARLGKRKQDNEEYLEEGGQQGGRAPPMNEAKRRVYQRVHEEYEDSSTDGPGRGQQGPGVYNNAREHATREQSITYQVRNTTGEDQQQLQGKGGKVAGALPVAQKQGALCGGVSGAEASSTAEIEEI